MGRTGLVLLNLVIGLVVGLLLGYAFFHGSNQPQQTQHQQEGMSHDTDVSAPADSQHYYYRLSDTTISRHTVSGSGDDLHHRVDTLKVQPRQQP